MLTTCCQNFKITSDKNNFQQLFDGQPTVEYFNNLTIVFPTLFNRYLNIYTRSFFNFFFV